ncbi:MAG: hypothetical protein ACI9JN_000482 [Bacteroidia bacterium]|jgi:hypothetical protein
MKIDLNRPFPYPIVDGTRPKLLSSVGFSLFIFLFLLVFQPFGISELEGNIVLVVLGFGGVTFFVQILSYFLVPQFFPTFFIRDKWTIKRMIVFGSAQFFSIAIFNWLYSALSCDTPLDISGFIGFIFITLAVGIIPSAFGVVLMERVLRKQHASVASNVLHEIELVKNQHHSKKVMSLSSENGKDVVRLDPDQLVCIKAEGNYAEITFVADDGIKRKLVRNTLSSLMSVLESETLIKQCHRSFIVNFNFVDEITGNARNYNLHLTQIDLTIPVSRSFSKDFIKKFQNN